MNVDISSAFQVSDWGLQAGFATWNPMLSWCDNEETVSEIKIHERKLNYGQRYLEGKYSRVKLILDEEDIVLREKTGLLDKNSLVYKNGKLYGAKATRRWKLRALSGDEGHREIVFEYRMFLVPNEKNKYTIEFTTHGLAQYFDDYDSFQALEVVGKKDESGVIRLLTEGIQLHFLFRQFKHLSSGFRQASGSVNQDDDAYGYRAFGPAWMAEAEAMKLEFASGGTQDGLIHLPDRIVQRLNDEALRIGFTSPIYYWSSGRGDRVKTLDPSVLFVDQNGVFSLARGAQLDRVLNHYETADGMMSFPGLEREKRHESFVGEIVKGRKVIVTAEIKPEVLPVSDNGVVANDANDAAVSNFMSPPLKGSETWEIAHPLTTGLPE
ncbi:MAG: hypothetical protein ACPG5T_09730, partial [Endozoicomonas sp.]